MCPCYYLLSLAYFLIALLTKMCRHEYGANWHHDASHCPNLVPSQLDQAMFPSLRGKSTVAVVVQYKEFDQSHDSLAGFWNDWYNDYIKAPFPRLIVRFEDVIFHPKEITRIACECAGGEIGDGPFRYIVESAKKGAVHGTDKTSYVDALIRYGTEKDRYSGFETADLEFARTNLDPELMRLLEYKFPPVEGRNDET
jgi:hypothetical protein